MDEPVMRPTPADPQEYLATIGHGVRRADAQTLMAMMGAATGQPAVMRGPSIVGFGSYHYRYASGRESDACATGFAARKASLSLYGLTHGPDAACLLQRLGKHRTGAACLYVNTLADVDLAVLRELMETGYRCIMAELHFPTSG